MIETARAHEWLYQILVNDATLNSFVGGRVYRRLAPPASAMPYLIFQYQAGHDVQAVGPYRIMSSLVYVVKVVGLATSYATLKTIADRIDVLLQAASGATADGRVLSCVRESAIDYEEEDAGVRYQHLGGQYRLYVQPA